MNRRRRYKAKQRRKLRRWYHELQGFSIRLSVGDAQRFEMTNTGAKLRALVEAGLLTVVPKY